jgi:23S rRNA (cytosine1962-C5)-methyltransferase
VSDGASSRIPKVRLRKDLRKALHAGVPWLYRDALADTGAVADGAVVLVVGKDGRPLGRGFFTSSGPIAVRMLTTDRNDELPALVEKRLEQALVERRSLFSTGETSAFRWVHGEGDRLPGLHVDVYARYASAFFDGSGARAFYLGSKLPELLLTVGSSLELVAVLERGRRTSSASGKTAALVGQLPEGEVLVFEHGLAFGVDLVHAQKGGLFLDQRDNRRRVRELARGRSVLNLFGYTGGFSLHAALGGATGTTTVDSAPSAIETARRNFERNAERLGDAARSAEFVVSDAFEFLEEARSRGRRWELVISDPPSFAPNERARPAAVLAYRRLSALCASVVAPGGIFCAGSCSSHVGEAELLRAVNEGVRDASRSFVPMGVHGAASDHPVRPEFPEGRYLKFAIGSVR